MTNATDAKKAALRVVVGSGRRKKRKPVRQIHAGLVGETAAQIQQDGCNNVKTEGDLLRSKQEPLIAALGFVINRAVRIPPPAAAAAVKESQLLPAADSPVDLSLKQQAGGGGGTSS